MEVFLFSFNNIQNSLFFNFCNLSKKIKFNYKNFSDINVSTYKKKLLLIDQNISLNFLKKTLKKSEPPFLDEIIFFIPKNYKKELINHNFDFFTYPIKFLDFESYILNFFGKSKNAFRNLILRNDGTLVNINNNKMSHLTEIEYKIMNFLIQNIKVKKNILNTSVLNQSPSIDSKSLDSHLYRLRKKLILVDPEKKIVLTNNQNLKII